MKTPTPDVASPRRSDTTTADVLPSGDRAESVERPPMPTPGLILGPYYPVHLPGDADHRLWRGTAPPDASRPLRFTGTVRSLSGEPLPGVQVELWQADPAGRYPHPCAPKADLVPPGFVGYGRVGTDARGGFAFDSLVPGAYGEDGRRRARHLHVQITGRFERLVTQVFFPDDPARADDRWWQAAARPHALCAHAVSDTAAGLHLDWMATLRRG